MIYLQDYWYVEYKEQLTTFQKVIKEICKVRHSRFWLSCL